MSTPIAVAHAVESDLNAAYCQLREENASTEEMQIICTRSGWYWWIQDMECSNGGDE